MDFLTCQAMKWVTDWLPFLIFIGLMIYFIRKAKVAQVDTQRLLSEYRESHIAEMRKANAILERIAAALEQPRSE